MSNYITATVKNPESVVVTVEISMPLGDWKLIQTDLKVGSAPSRNLLNAIGISIWRMNCSLTEKLHK